MHEDAGDRGAAISSHPAGVLNEQIVEAIASTGCYVGPSIIDAGLTAGLRDRVAVLRRTQQLRAAQVGRAAGRQTAPALRGDSIVWLEQGALAPVEVETMARIDSLRLALNAALFLGAQEIECHYARYPIGTEYRRHRDRFSDLDTRVVSLVFYLNARWRKQHGGELLIDYPEGLQPSGHHADGHRADAHDSTGEAAQCVLPCSGTMVAFLSEQFPHRVLPATRPRLALTGWMRRRALIGR